MATQAQRLSTPTPKGLTMQINYRLLGLLAIVLGIALMGVGSLGVLYRTNPMADQAKFIQKPNGMTLAEASNYMIPGGFLGGVAAFGLAVFSLRRRSDDASPAQPQGEDDEA
jgi:hypothetical protein